MSRHHRCARTADDRASLYDEITNKIIAELDAGRVPWVRPWGTAAAQASLAMPQSAATGRRYSGINVLILWGAAVEHGFTCQRWLTFRQAVSLGGHIRKGERGTTVVYADRFVPADEKLRAIETGDEAQTIPFLKDISFWPGRGCDAPSARTGQRRIVTVDLLNVRLAPFEKALIGDRQMSLDEASQPVAAIDQLLGIPQGLSGGGSDAMLAALGRKFDALAAELEMLQKQDEQRSTADNSSGDRETGRSLERIEAVLKSLDPIERAIMTIPAETVVGLGVKARHAAHVLSNYWTDAPEQLDWDARAVRLLIEFRLCRRRRRASANAAVNVNISKCIRSV